MNDEIPDIDFEELRRRDPRDYSGLKIHDDPKVLLEASQKTSGYMSELLFQLYEAELSIIEGNVYAADVVIDYLKELYDS